MRASGILDLMLMLVEPVAYMILALAERAGLDPVIYREEDEDEAEDREVLGLLKKERLNRVQKLALLGKAPASQCYTSNGRNNSRTACATS